MKKITIVFEKMEINWSIVLFDSALLWQNLCWKNKQKSVIPMQAKLRIGRISIFYQNRWQQLKNTVFRFFL